MNWHDPNFYHSGPDRHVYRAEIHAKGPTIGPMNFQECTNGRCKPARAWWDWFLLNVLPAIVLGTLGVAALLMWCAR